MVMVMTKAKHLDVTQARSALSLKQASSGENTTPFSILFTHGSLVFEVYQPMTTDHQKPHDRDECYVIIEGHGNFEMGDEIISFGPGDFLFVPAGLPHRFTGFGDTMSTWVMFYGPNGGENANSTEKTG
jgi:mannose-6-phosphate isomerase-like protein (cupin superfamily)